MKLESLNSLGGVDLEHSKTYYSQTIRKNNKEIIIEGPVDSEKLKNYYFDDGLKAFRPPKKQYGSNSFDCGF